MYCKKIQSNNYHFHKGFYENGKDKIKMQLTKIIDLNQTNEFGSTVDVYFTAENFLHGLCHVFAFALHKKFGYDILKIESESGITEHCCCVTDYNGKEIYIDVRGLTTDYDEFLDEFQPNLGKNPLKSKVVNLEDYDDCEEELKFAEEIITKYYNYYSL